MVACEVLLSPRISSFFEVTFLVWGELAMVACEVLLSPRIIANCLQIDIILSSQAHRLVNDVLRCQFQ